MNTYLTDYFHVIEDEEIGIINLQPDLKNGHNPELRKVFPYDYWKLYLDEQIIYFCKKNHIYKFLWKILGRVECVPDENNLSYNFTISFIKKKLSVRFSKTFTSDILLDNYIPLEIINNINSLKEVNPGKIVYEIL